MASANTVITTVQSTPRWIAEPTKRENLACFPAKLDASQFADKDSINVVLTAGAAQNATSITITAITLPAYVSKIPSGTVLYFGGAKVARLTADYTGGTTMTVAALPTALISGDTAAYAPFGTRVAIQSGTLVGRTRAERATNTPFGPWIAGDDEVGLVVFDVSDATRNNNIELLKSLVTIKENYLPNWSVLSALVNEVQTVTIAGTLTAGNAVITGPNGSFPLAFNGNLAAIQAVIDLAYGASRVVVAGTIASFTLTYSGTAVAGLDASPIGVDISNLTGATSVVISETVKGGSAWLQAIRNTYRTITGVN